MPFFEHEGLNFNYCDKGSGTPFFFQHGLGADVNQVLGLFQPPSGIRLVIFDCRAHGETRPLGDPDKISIAAFADDLRALMDYLQIQRAIVGGISMGAAVAQNFVLRFPERVMGLVLLRPAWVDRPRSQNVSVFSEIAQLIRRYGAKLGREKFIQTKTYRDIQREFPNTADSFSGQFNHPRAEETVIKLERIPNDAPNSSLEELAGIRVPTLVLANRQDPVHPFEYGETLARVIPNADFIELTSKSVSLERHGIEVQQGIGEFLTKRFLARA